MPNFTTGDCTDIHYRDCGHGQPIVFCHGWPLSGDAFEAQMLYFAERSYRVVAHDRRGHGRSGQPCHGNDLDTYADDLSQLIEHLDLRDAILIGHSTGGGEVSRYIGRKGCGRVAMAVLIAAIPPLAARSEGDTFYTGPNAFDGIAQRLESDRSQFFLDLSLPYFGFNREQAPVSPGVRDAFWRQAMMSGAPACIEGIASFSQCDITADLARFDVPTLIVHGDDDQIVPMRNSALQSSRIARHSELLVYVGGDHGLIMTQQQRVNDDLWTFVTAHS